MSAPIPVVTTGHDESGKSVFIDTPAAKIYNPHVSILYRTEDEGALDMNKGADLATFAKYDPATHGVFPTTGSAVCVAEWLPGAGSAADSHRTLSCDFGVVIQGEIECHLQDGEKRLLKTGEMLIQRGTMHHWVNPSSTVTARMIFFVLPSQPVAGAKD